MAKDSVVVEGRVWSAEGYGFFTVKLGNGTYVRATAAGKLRRPGRPKINIIPGDRVLVELSPYDLTRGRITRRFLE